MRLFFVFVGLSSLVSRVQGAACCGASAAAPTILSGDDRAQITASVAHSYVVGDAPAEGIPVFRGPGDLQTTETLRLDGAFLVGDRWQVGLSLPLLRQSRQNGVTSISSTSLGDVGLNTAYEIWPEWTYSSWRPHALLFSQLTLPTGTAIYDFHNPFAVDAMGRGFFSLSLGGLALKVWGHWDANLLAEIHRSFSRTFGNAAGGPLQATPGWGASGALGGGYSLGQWRFGLSLAPLYEGATQTVQSGLTSLSSSQLVWSSIAQVSFMPSDEDSLAISYLDQTIFGPAVNVALNRGLALSYQTRWPR